MAGYPRPPLWERLDSNESEIRILTLSQAQVEGEPLQCSLRKWGLERYPRYDAISWAWGGSGSMLTIIIDGSRWQIPASLESCLRMLHGVSRERTFWVDAICVNQFDNVERANQVELMEQIFSNAGTVWVWLGVKAVESRWGYPGDLSELMASLPGFTHWEILSPQTLRFVTSKNSLWALSVEWWRRVWPMQEVILARNLKLCFDNQILDLDVFHEISKLIANSPELRLPQVYDLIRLANFRSPAQQSPHNRSTQFVELLYHSRIRFTTDPRDRVYGLLGACTFLFGKDFLRPDYTKPAAIVYQELAHRLIEKTKSLAILNQVVPLYHTNPSIPSWAPDLGARYDHRPEVCRLSYMRKYNTYQSVNFMTQYTELESVARRDGSLFCPGVVFDNVQAVFEPCEPQPHRSTLEEVKWYQFTLLSWLHQYRQFTYSAGDDAYKIPFSKESFAATVMRSSGTSNYDRTMWKAFEALWVFDLTRDIEPGSTPGTIAGTLGSPAQQATDNIIARSDHQWLRGVLETMREKQIKRGVLSQKNHGKLCAESKTVFYGNLAGTRFFLTKNGRTGLGPVDTQVGDDLAVLAGGNVPYVLRTKLARPESNEKLSYHFVGESYIDGAMQGEIGRNGEKLEVIELV